MFEYKDVHKCTSDSLVCKLINYFVLVSSDLWLYIMDTQVKRGPELSNDHYLAVSWITWHGTTQDKPGITEHILRVRWDCMAEARVWEIFQVSSSRFLSKDSKKAKHFDSQNRLSGWLCNIKGIYYALLNKLM